MIDHKEEITLNYSQGNCPAFTKITNTDLIWTSASDKHLANNSFQEHNPSQADSCQRYSVPCMEPKVHYHVHKSLPSDLTLSYLNPVHIIKPYLLKIHFNINLPAKPKYLPFEILKKKIYIFCLSHTLYTPHPFHPPWFDHLNNTCWKVKSMKLLVTQLLLVPHYSLSLRSK
jgi:hypothetical protein